MIWHVYRNLKKRSSADKINLYVWFIHVHVQPELLCNHTEWSRTCTLVWIKIKEVNLWCLGTPLPIFNLESITYYCYHIPSSLFTVYAWFDGTRTTRLWFVWSFLLIAHITGLELKLVRWSVSISRLTQDRSMLWTDRITGFWAFEFCLPIFFSDAKKFNFSVFHFVVKLVCWSLAGLASIPVGKNFSVN